MSSSTTALSFDVHSPRNPREYPHVPYVARTRIIDLHYGSVFIQIFLVGTVKRIFSAKVCIDCSGSSKVIDSGINQQHVCLFLLVHVYIAFYFYLLFVYYLIYLLMVSDTNEPATWFNWASGHPRAFLHRLRDCVRMGRNGGRWYWHETPCTALNWKYRFICQYGMMYFTLV